MNQEKTAIIGIGDIPIGKYPEYDEMELATIVISKAIDDSGLRKDQIDGFFAGPDNLIPDMFFTAWLAEKLRLEPKRMAEIACGGASGTLAINHAINEIKSGNVKNALVFSTSQDHSQMFNLGPLFMKFFERAIGVRIFLLVFRFMGIMLWLLKDICMNMVQLKKISQE